MGSFSQKLRIPSPKNLSGYGSISGHNAIYLNPRKHYCNLWRDGQDLTGSRAAYAALITPEETGIPRTFSGDINISGLINNVALPGIIPQTPANLPLSPYKFQEPPKRNDFEIRYELYHQLTWSRSPSTGVIDYYVYRNESKVPMLGNSIFAYTDYNRKKRTDYTYAITAFHSSGNDKFLLSLYRKRKGSIVLCKIKEFKS